MFKFTYVFQYFHLKSYAPSSSDVYIFIASCDSDELAQTTPELVDI